MNENPSGIDILPLAVEFNFPTILSVDVSSAWEEVVSAYYLNELI